MSSKRAPDVVPDRIRKAWDKAKANVARLDECEGPHDFQPIGEGREFRRVRCSKCGGEISRLNRHWYEHAMRHVRADIDHQIETLYVEIKKHGIGDDDPMFSVIEGLKRARLATGKPWPEV